MVIGGGGSEGQVKSEIDVPAQVVILFLSIFEPDVIARGDASNTRKSHPVDLIVS